MTPNRRRHHRRIRDQGDITLFVKDLLSLACAVVPFQLLMMTVVNALGAVRRRQSIITNMAFPRLLLPISSMLTEAVSFVAALTLLVLMMVVYGIAPARDVLWLPIALLVTAAFAV